MSEPTVATKTEGSPPLTDLSADDGSSGSDTLIVTVAARPSCVGTGPSEVLATEHASSDSPTHERLKAMVTLFRAAPQPAHSWTSYFYAVGIQHSDGLSDQELNTRLHVLARVLSQGSEIYRASMAELGDKDSSKLVDTASDSSGGQWDDSMATEVADYLLSPEHADVHAAFPNIEILTPGEALKRRASLMPFVQKMIDPSVTEESLSQRRVPTTEVRFSVRVHDGRRPPTFHDKEVKVVKYYET